ncbi:hypothetical protein [Povalibacter sp.]|uniref:hypothetical protein n=1 Tax=Povalibacter sp. TaxID=1962978 RepID=UPI002F42FD4C
MTLIELPRALEDYFAFAETEPTRRGRRFSISLPYFQGSRLERLQWWYHVTPGQEQMYEGTGLVVFRERAIERFRRHIEQWLANTHQQLHGDEPIPHLSTRPRSIPETETDTRPLADVIPLPVDRVAVNG